MVRRARVPVGMWLTSIALACIACRSSGERTPAPDSSEAGPRSELVFEGANKVTERSLRRDLAAEIDRLHERGFRKADLDDLAFEVERTYRLLGYHFVKVSYEHSESRGVIRVEEGNRVLVNEVRFAGNVALSKAELDALVTSQRTLLGLGRPVYVESRMREIRDAVIEAYFERGFREVAVGAPESSFDSERTRATVTLRIVEGPQYILDAIDFSSTPLLEPETLEARFAGLRGSAYVPRLRLEVLSGVQELYADVGHPFAEVTVSPGELDRTVPGRVGLTLHVEARPKTAVRVREVRVEGNEKTATGYVRGRILVGDGEVFDGAKVRESYSRLFRTGLFRTVDVRLSDPVAQEGELEVRDLVVEVLEGPTLEYFFELGFGSYDLARAKAGVRKRNLLGRGLLGRAEVLGSIRGAAATVGITDPWFLRTEWTADLPVTARYREEPSFTIRELASGLRLSRQLLQHLVGGAAYRISLSEVNERGVDDESEEGDNLLIGAAGPFVEYDSRNDIFLPTRGVRSRVFGEVGSSYLGSELDFLHGGIAASAYFQVLPGTVIAAAAETEWIVPLRSTDTIPIQERLFNGGENSVRSFKEAELGPKDRRDKPRGGEVRNLVSVELRQRIWQELSIAGFFDYGNIAIDEEKPWEDFRPGVGFGLRYGLPIGPARVDVGFNPDRRKDEDEDLWVIHFAVGMAY